MEQNNEIDKNEEQSNVEESTPVKEEVVETETEEQSEGYSEEELKDIKEDLDKLDDGTLNTRNRTKMTRLLKYIVEQPPYTGTFNPHTTVMIVDEVFEGMEKMDKIPAGGVIISNHTEDEIKEFNKRLWRLILSSQFQRTKLSRDELDVDYVQLNEPRAILTHSEYDLLNYLASSLALLQGSPTKDCLLSGSWANSLDFEGKKIGLALVTSHKDPIKRIRSKLNLINESAGTLTHSGMVIKLSSPSGLDAALLNDNIMSAKINSSFDTQGNALGSTSVYTNEILVEQAFRSIEETNLGDITKEIFEDNLSILDVEQLAATLAVSMFPTGYTIYRRCGSLNCSGTRSILINPRRTILHRKDRLTENQLRHLTRGFAKVDISTVEDYRNKLCPDLSKFLNIEEDIYLKLRVPMFSDYKRISRGWLDYISNKSLELVSGSSDEQARKAFLYDTFSKSTLMLYSSWIEGVYVKSEEGDFIPHLTRIKKAKGVTEDTIYDADIQLDEFIADFRGNPELQNRILDTIVNFIKESTLTVHVLPKTKCEECGTLHLPEGEEIESECISYSPSELFFTLLHLKTENVSV